MWESLGQGKRGMASPLPSESSHDEKNGQRHEQGEEAIHPIGRVIVFGADDGRGYVPVWNLCPRIKENVITYIISLTGRIGDRMIGTTLMAPPVVCGVDGLTAIMSHGGSIVPIESITVRLDVGTNRGRTPAFKLVVRKGIAKDTDMAQAVRPNADMILVNDVFFDYNIARGIHIDAG